MIVMLRLFFVLYFIKLLVGNGFQTECVIQNVLWIQLNDFCLLLFIFVRFFIRFVVLAR